MSDAIATVEHTAWCRFLRALEDRGLEETLLRRRDDLPDDLATVVNSQATWWEHQDRIDTAIAEAWDRCNPTPACDVMGCDRA